MSRERGEFTAIGNEDAKRRKSTERRRKRAQRIGRDVEFFEIGAGGEGGRKDGKVVGGKVQTKQSCANLGKDGSEECRQECGGRAMWKQ